MRPRPLAAVLLLSASLPSTARAAQKLPYTFDPAKAAKPAETQQAMTSSEAGLPDLPASSMTTLGAADATLWFFPESASLLTRAKGSGPAPARGA